ncbi:F/Y-rich N-terminus-domain-containing protein [Halteromyces radiatus]|uniref:F/Y-rich N-terminus-domain-containing protein n=1 Tax=Halteromyces radiatus TaxID=101107 RepID=UPI00221EF5CA|nr:F/Y-rich N-terminus-domain-containing protein [Halteromyces radiatus]KAI8086475.1 F/Y-rich N-terminus-domain-containing protein [Halteromyces radiatus]
MPANNKKSSTRPHQRQQQMQQVSTSVRTYYEVDRDDHGQYILPVEIDSWTVVNLGTVVYDRPAYHNQRYVYPVNYTVRKWYRSMVDAKSDTQYTCRILDNGREPKFEVTADDCPMTYSGPTPTTVWTIIVRRAFAIRNQEYGHNPVGPDFFGLRKNTIAKMIQDLPNVEKCSQYVWQTFEPARFNKPGRNRRRLDTMISGSILGGVNYSLTSGRLNTVASHQQHQLQIQQRRLSSAMGITGTIEANQTTTTSSSSSLSPSSSPLSSSSCSPPPQSSSVTETNNSNNSNSGTDRQSSIHSHHHTHHHHRSSSSYLQSPSSYHPPAPIETI